MELNRFQELLKVTDNGKPICWALYSYYDNVFPVYLNDIRRKDDNRIVLFSGYVFYYKELYENKQDAWVVLAKVVINKAKSQMEQSRQIINKAKSQMERIINDAKSQIEQIINDVAKIHQQHGLPFNRNMLLPIVNLVKRVDEDGNVYYYREDESLAGEWDEHGVRIFDKNSDVFVEYRQVINESDLIEMYEKHFNCVVNVILE